MIQRRIENKIQQQEAKIRQIPFVVFVFGSGKEYPVPEYHRKRKDIINSLTEEGFSVYTCEDLSADLPSELSLVEQEAIQAEEADWLIFLNTSEGPLAELSSYCTNPNFIRKAFVLYPAKYDPVTNKSLTFPQAVLQNYPYTLAYNEAQLDRCDLVLLCRDRAKALRRAKFLEEVGKPRTLQF